MLKACSYQVRAGLTSERLRYLMIRTGIGIISNDTNPDFSVLKILELGVILKA